MRGAWLTGAGALLALVVAGALTTPWKVLPAAEAHRATANGHLDFTAAEFAREAEFHHLVRPPSYLGLLLSLLVAALLGFTPLGARIITAVSAGRWWLGVLAGGAICVLLPRLTSMLASARSEQVLRSYGLSNQTWSGWLTDQFRGTGVGLALTLPALLLVVFLARRMTTHWWIAAAGGAAILTVVMSFLYPVVVEPIYNSFHPLEAGVLRKSLISMADQDGIRVKDVLVADASRRTTALNAYVSGFGSSRRIVLYDTLLAQATPDEVRLVVAHELGHVKHHDVARGTALGALGAVAGLALLAGALGSSWLRQRAGFASAADPRAVAAILALAALIGTLVGPVVNLVSRRVEAHADLHALELTHDPKTFIDVERRLALTNIASLGGNHTSYVIFGSHPSTPDRIAMARAWASAHDLPVPPPLVAQR